MCFPGLDIGMLYRTVLWPESRGGLCLVSLSGACVPSDLYRRAQQPCLQQAAYKNGKGAGPHISLPWRGIDYDRISVGR